MSVSATPGLLRQAVAVAGVPELGDDGDELAGAVEKARVTGGGPVAFEHSAARLDDERSRRPVRDRDRRMTPLLL